MKLNQKQKSGIYDWMVDLIDRGELELLFKLDETSEHDFVSCSSSEALLNTFIIEMNKKALSQERTETR